jgi:thymidylate kinase
LLAETRTVVDQTWGPVARHLYYYTGVARASEEIGVHLRRQPVVCDKYFATVVAYSRAAGVAVCHPPIYPIIEPDFTFLLVVPPKVRRMRLKRRGEITAIHAAFLRMEIEANVLAEYRRLALCEIDNAGPNVQVTCDRIIDYLRQAGAEWPRP